jgi:hypothetical protein
VKNGRAESPQLFCESKKRSCGERCFGWVALWATSVWMPCQRVHCRFSVEIRGGESSETSACLRWQAGEASNFSTVIGNEPAGKLRFNLLHRPASGLEAGSGRRSKKSVSLYIGDGGCTFLGDLACFVGFWREKSEHLGLGEVAQIMKIYRHG